jgi:hypothetical protein
MKIEIKNIIDDALFNFYLEADHNTISESLKNDIQNFDEYTKRKKQIIFLLKAKANKNHNEYLLQLATKFQEALLLNAEKPIAMLKQITQTNPSFALYRNLEKLSKEEIIEFIKDKNFVQLLEQLEKNEKGY